MAKPNHTTCAWSGLVLMGLGVSAADRACAQAHDASIAQKAHDRTYIFGLSIEPPLMGRGRNCALVDDLDNAVFPFGEAFGGLTFQPNLGHRQ